MTYSRSVIDLVILENDYAGTPTGQAILKKRWFTGYTNPWDRNAPPAPADGAEQ